MAGRGTRRGNKQLRQEDEAIGHLKDAVSGGTPWHVALLEAIALWLPAEESYNGRRYVYLIDGEAFDWVLLAEREGELRDLLFSGRLPREIGADEFRDAMGSAKYHAYLNYFYGVTVEKFVLLAVEEEIEKERHGQVFSGSDDGEHDAHQRLYGARQKTLLGMFRTESCYAQVDGIGLDELKAFTYWLFKYRLRNHDKERVASDTAKGVRFLTRQRGDDGIAIPGSESPRIIEHKV